MLIGQNIKREIFFLDASFCRKFSHVAYGVVLDFDISLSREMCLSTDDGCTLYVQLIQYPCVQVHTKSTDFPIK